MVWHNMSDTQQQFIEWQNYADEDELAAEAILKENGPANPICFHAQQLAEKYLKAYLIRKGERFEKRHQLDYLLTLCKGIDPTFEELRDECLYLTEFYTETRYPGDIPEFSVDECKEALERAKKVKVFVIHRM